jgi:aminoglycoside phosphotransferase (APT) family kinase protein
VVAWENLLHATRLQRAAGTAPVGEVPGSAFTERALEQYLSAKFPDWGNVKITGLRKLAGGFSKITILFDAEDTAGRKQALVIRAEQPVSLVFFDGAAIENEYWALNLARDAGVRVAEPLWLEPDASLFGAKFLVSRKAAGRNIGTAVSVREEVSDSLLQDLVANLYQHSPGRRAPGQR